MDILGDIIEILFGGITQTASAIGTGLSELASSVFLTTTGTGSEAVTTLSTFGTLIVVFAGISLAIGLSKFVVGWLTSLGARN